MFVSLVLFFLFSFLSSSLLRSIKNIHKQSHRRAPKLLDRLKMSLKYKTTERLGAWGMFHDFQHFKGVEGHARALEWD
jgi:hypothetical protein